MEIFIFLVYIGGVVHTPDESGFWKSSFWPYYLGKKLVELINKKPA